nr:hypothetical protein Q903MT_gene20 [Picea sitchensis]
MDFGIEQGRIVYNEHTPFIGENRTGRIIFFSTHFELLIIRVSRLREEMLICILYMMLPNALVQINLSYSALRMDRCMVY